MKILKELWLNLLPAIWLALFLISANGIDNFFSIITLVVAIIIGFCLIMVQNVKI